MKKQQIKTLVSFSAIELDKLVNGFCHTHNVFAIQTDMVFSTESKKLIHKAVIFYEVMTNGK